MSGESTLFQEGVDEAAANAEIAGYEVIRSTPRTLLLDLDTVPQMVQFLSVKDVVDNNFGIARQEEWKSKSGNVHKLIWLAEPIEDPAMRYALQAALGSDPVKEALSIRRLLNGVKEPSMLFKPKVITEANTGLDKVLASYEENRREVEEDIG